MARLALILSAFFHYANSHGRRKQYRKTPAKAGRGGLTEFGPGVVSGLPAFGEGLQLGIAVFGQRHQQPYIKIARMT
jgi:hypothetical protein